MIDFLVLQIRMGKITIDDIPEKWKEAVKAKLQKG